MLRGLKIFLLFLIAIIAFTQCKNERTTNETSTQKSEEKVAANVNAAKPLKVDSVSAQAVSTPNSQSELTSNEAIAVDTIAKTEVKSVAKVEEKKEVIKPKKKQKKRSKISFEETTHQFGTITSGDKIRHKFKFKNRGNAPLVIKNVDVSCGCTFPSYPFIPIKPGEEGEIDVSFDSKHKVGRQKPTITVVTNGRPRTVKLYMEGFVE